MTHRRTNRKRTNRRGNASQETATPKPTFTTFVELSDGKLAEEGYDGKDTYFLLYDPRSGRIRKQIPPLVTSAGNQYYPVLNDLVRHGQVMLPSDAIDYGHEMNLFNEITQFVDRWYEETDKNQLVIDALYVIFTYIADLVPVSPYLRKYGKYGKGKSTFLKVVGGLCHRAFHIAGCSTEPALRRTFDAIQGTALIDEADFNRSDLYAPIMRILNLGYDAKIGWYTCCDETNPNKQLSFRVYCPKILATRERWKDIALESRCINSQSRENRRLRPLYQTEAFERERQQITNKLQMWRFRNYHDFKRNRHLLEDKDIVRKVFGEDFEASKRIKQIMIPLALAVNDTNLKQQLRTIMVQQNERLQSIDEEFALEEKLRKALGQLLLKRMETGLVELARLITLRRTLPFTVKEISLQILGPEYSSPAYGKEVSWQSRRLTSHFRDRWELKIHSGTGNSTVVEFPIDKLVDILGLTTTNGTLTSLTSVTQVTVDLLDTIRAELTSREHEVNQQSEATQGEQALGRVASVQTSPTTEDAQPPERVSTQNQGPLDEYVRRK